MRVVKLIIAIIGQFVLTSSAARILAVFPTPSYSHQVVYHALAKALADQGHEIVVLTPDTLPHPIENVTEISLRYLYDEWRQINFADINNVQLLIKITQFNLNAMQTVLSMPSVSQLLHGIKRNQSFDAVLVEYIGHKPIYAFANYFNVPLIGISSFDLGATEHASIGNVHHPIVHPLNFLPYYGGQLGIVERIGCVIMYLFYRFVYEPLLDQKYDEIIRHTFNIVPPHTVTPDLVLVNAHPALGYVRPMVPNSIPIGFMHIEKSKPVVVPSIRQLLDNSIHGVIYFSMGTNVNSSKINMRYIEMVLSTFDTLPYDVIMKWDSERDLDVPKNVHLFKWVPQQDVLAHPNIKLFITQGGQQSVEEAIDRTVPMLIIPVYGDQFANALRMSKLGVGQHIPLTELNEKEFRRKIDDLITNATYKLNIESLNEIVRDEPMTSLEKAVWWVEYVIRHKGAKHLKYDGLTLPTYQLFLLDVIIAWCISSLITLYIVRRVIKYAGTTIKWTKTKLKSS